MNRPDATLDAHGWRSYVLAVVSTAAAVALTRVTWPFFSPTPFAPVFAAVAVTTHWGSGPAGLLAMVLSAVGAAFFFPTTGPHPWNPITIPAFVAVALVGNLLIAGRNRATAALRASEAQLRATLEHLRESEETLRRAQKVEAVGQLAAGVAHNFNNLLTVTMGYADVLTDEDLDDETRARAIGEIRRATERGATLARQLLAFGRRHDARVTRVGLESTITGLHEMLTRVIREDITLIIDADNGPAAVLIDRHDLEQVIFNLVINARDALPDGGEIHVQTGLEHVEANDPRRDPQAPPGPYALVRVRDNGVGMTPEVQARLFEPFFTTKEVGEGTGLGLPFVHGIAQHAGGFVAVESAPGGGTTVTVYLPPAPAADAATARSSVRPRQAAPASATILLVEDEEAVRRMTTQALSRAGYRVLAAATPGEARELFERHHGEIALLLTDVVMPEMRGPELADLLLARRPDLRVLFVSGYSEGMPVGAAPGGNQAFLGKPFSVAALTAAIGELLPSPSAS